MANNTGLPIEIRGLEELRRLLGRIPRHLTDEMDAEIAAASNEFVNKAVLAAPVDSGTLRHGITFKKIKKMHYEVVSAAHYSAYVEWGTITQVKVPPELQSYAIQFKGKGILKTGGMKPHPFFFIQIPAMEKYLNENLNKAVNRVVNP